jgi:16S rRNA (cytidine1402-2'-O)-methyltransferase
VGKLYVVSTPIGNLEDVSLRALRVLREVALIAAEDTRVTRKLLSRYDIHTRLVPYHEHNQRYQSGLVLRALDAGDVALVSDAGTPVLSDPGQDLIRTAIGLGIDVVAVPGPSAITHALTVSGLDAEPFLFVGFLPAARRDRSARLRAVAPVQATLVVFEAPHRVRQTLEELALALGDRRVAVCRELTKLHEQVARGTASELAASFGSAPKGEITLVLAAREQGAPELPDPALLSELAAAVGAKRASALAAELSGLPRNRLYAAITSR